MNYQFAFENCIQQTPQACRELQWLSKARPQTASLTKLIRYCQLWCCLAELFYAEKPGKIRAPLMFVLDHRRTNSYSFQLVYFTHKCIENLTEHLLVRLGLKATAGEAFHWNTLDFNETQRAAAQEQLLQVMGLVNYCLTRVELEDVHVGSCMQPELAVLHEFKIVLRVMACWLFAGHLHNEPFAKRKYDDIAMLYNACQTLGTPEQYANNLFLHNIRKNACVLQLVNQGEFQVEKQVQHGIGQACFAEAVAQGWPANEYSEHVYDANTHVHNKQVPAAEDLPFLEPVPRSIGQTFTVGVNPLSVCTFLPLSQDLEPFSDEETVGKQNEAPALP